MAIEGEVVIAEITAVVKRVTGLAAYPRYSPGYVTVSSPWGYLTLVDGSVQGIPPLHRVVGARVKLRWGMFGGYCGPVFVSAVEEPQDGLGPETGLFM